MGIDVGIKDFAVLSTGEKIENLNYLKNSLQRLKVLQKRVSKKVLRTGQKLNKGLLYFTKKLAIRGIISRTNSLLDSLARTKQ